MIQVFPLAILLSVIAFHLAEVIVQTSKILKNITSLIYISCFVWTARNVLFNSFDVLKIDE